MSTITLRLSDQLLHELDHEAKTLHVSRAEYIRYAIQYMNKKIHEQAQRKRLKAASLKVRDESLRVCEEFAEFEYDEKT